MENIIIFIVAVQATLIFSFLIIYKKAKKDRFLKIKKNENYILLRISDEDYKYIKSISYLKGFKNEREYINSIIQNDLKTTKK